MLFLLVAQPVANEEQAFRAPNATLDGGGLLLPCRKLGLQGAHDRAICETAAVGHLHFAWRLPRSPERVADFGESAKSVLGERSSRLTDLILEQNMHRLYADTGNRVGEA